jgi:hypothetical protein
MAATTYSTRELALLTALAQNRGELSPAALERLLALLKRRG